MSRIIPPLPFKRRLLGADGRPMFKGREKQRGFIINPYAYPPPGDPYWANVVLLCHMDQANIAPTVLDSSTYNRTINTGTGGGPGHITTSIAKFGTASYAFATSASGTGASYTGTPAGFAIGTGDFTIEAQLYLASVTATFPCIFQINGAAAGRFYFAKYSGTNQLYVQAPSNTTGDIGPGTATLTTGWNHVAWTRASGTSKFWCNGAQTYSVADANNYQGGTTGFGFGNMFGAYGADYLDELRVTVGIARYTTTFTPPAAAFPNNA